MALKIVELIPSATSNSPFSLGRVKLFSLPEPNILKITKRTGGESAAAVGRVVPKVSNKSERSLEVITFPAWCLAEL